MFERHVEIVTKYGRQHAFAACPDEGGSYPAIILYMDAPGFRDELCDMARRIAKHGYYCLLPDLYYRLGRLRFDVARRDPAMSVVIRGAMTSLTNAMVAEDTRGMIAFLDAQKQVQAGPLGCVGHCMSGSFVTTLAALFPRMKAAASLYGVDVVTDRDDSPHRLVGQVEGELYFGFAEIDPSVPETVVPDLRTALDAAGTRYRIETYEGAHHGFCFAARPDYDAVASERAWTALFDLWNRNLKR
jgi:carboxymethylenebutenolidase